MRLLVAGGAGFLGSHLVERLLAEGHRVLALDNFVTGRRVNLERLAGCRELEVVEQDVVEPLAVDGPIDWVLHFASPASPPKYLERPIETLRVNAEGTRRLLELASERAARFLLASTSEVYGDPTVHPQPESYRGNVSPTGPRSVYDEGKRYAEALTMAYHRARGLDTRIVRIFNTYGPRMDPGDGRVVSNFINQALRGEPLTIHGDGNQTRSFQYVDDLVEGVTRLMRLEHHEPVNLGNPTEYTIVELARLVREVCGGGSDLAFVPTSEDDPRQRRPDITKARALLGWEPLVPPREGIRRTAEHFRATI
jgi:dTDP-glucose 4,6-dehydratase